ncbi:MAG: DUF5060 domain-containing protein, partial [Armatimonadota bacterium]
MRTLILLWVVLMTATIASAQKVEQWGRFEVSLEQQGDHDNPFLEVSLKCTFERPGQSVTVDGFYDGDGTWRVRFMPSQQGKWTYRTESNDPGLNGQTGSFECVAPSEGNHGPVVVRNTHYFAYADGTPYFQIGTTCYAWAHQGDELEEQTLKTLKGAPFNKLRMCVFPKSYAYNQNEPQYYPFEGKPLKDWDYTRFNPEFFRHFEQRVGDLLDLGIEADLILFHPYDRWGFAQMDAETDDRYLRYLVARLAAYRNVWWSMANEFDLMKAKTDADWDRFFQIVRDSDPYDHPRSIHNCRRWYDHTRPWVTHASIQSSHFANAVELRDQYGKPLIYDECRYEGNIPQGWGNLTARQMVRHFWLGTINGCYVGHGETYKHPQDILWWSKGGVLHGQSPPRIAFLKEIMAQGPPFEELAPQAELPGGNYMLSKPGEYYLIYFPSQERTTVELPGDQPYRCDGIDTWEMTVTPLNDVEPGQRVFAPPTEGFLLRLVAYRPGEKRRPHAGATASVSEGLVPLEVQFSASAANQHHWDFGDGSSSQERNPVHTYQKPGLHTVTLTVTDGGGRSATTYLSIAADTARRGPIVRLGFPEGETHPLTFHGDIKREDDGAFDLGDEEPWKWISVGDDPIEDLEGLRSFTIVGWAYATSLEQGSGGNRIVFNLNYNRAGFDLVCLGDGRLRLSVNEWPDRVSNDSSPGMIRVGEWVFFAVTYDGTEQRDNVRWYFGDADTPAKLDRTSTYARGPTGRGSGPLTAGNYNETIQRHGLDRQFRGKLRGLEITGSRVSSSGA